MEEEITVFQFAEQEKQRAHRFAETYEVEGNPTETKTYADWVELYGDFENEIPS